MTWRLQAELPLRLEYTPKSSDRVNWPNYSSQRHKRPMSYIKTLKQKDQSTSQGLGRVGWAKSSSCQARVSDFTGWQGDQTQHVPNVRTLTAQISSVHSSRVWKLRRSSCPSRLGSTLALSQHRLTVTFYWGGGRGGDRQWTVPYSTQRESLKFESTRIWETNEPVSVFVGSMDQEGSGVFSPFAGIYVRN